MADAIARLRELAAEKKVPLIDLYSLTLIQAEELGPDGCAEIDADQIAMPQQVNSIVMIYAWLSPGFMPPGFMSCSRSPAEGFTTRAMRPQIALPL